MVTMKPEAAAKRIIKVDQMVPLGFGIVFLLMVFLAIFTRSKMNHLVATTNLVAHTYKVEAYLKSLEKSLVDAETGQRGFILTGETGFLQPYNDSHQEIESTFKQLKLEIQDNPLQVERLGRVENLTHDKLDELARTITLKKAGQEQATKNLILSGEGKRIMDDIRAEVGEMLRTEDELLDKRQQEVKQAEKASNLVSLVGTTLAIATGGLIARFITQNITKLTQQVQQSVIQVTTSSTQIAVSGRQLEATANEQVAATHEVVATSKAIAATSFDLVRTMEEVAEMSQHTASATTHSRKDLTQMESTMRQLVTATDSIASRLEVIRDRANNIQNVVTTITKVADQTNLLSLNAAIEAEKAGEYGLGFGVVAREIRRLADQTAVATLDIEQMVKEMQTAVLGGVMEMDKFAKDVSSGAEEVNAISLQLSHIIEQVQDLTPRFEVVSQGMEAQTQGSQQISEAMVQVSEASVQAADSLREVNGAIEQLNSAAQGLRREMSRFTVA
jgi:methyl-accepting chemotaxis protein WspA